MDGDGEGKGKYVALPDLTSSLSLIMRLYPNVGKEKKRREGGRPLYDAELYAQIE